VEAVVAEAEPEAASEAVVVAVEATATPFRRLLYLGFTNATAFSATDVMPLAPWAKMTMTAQSLVSLLILSLVIARAVNVLT